MPAKINASTSSGLVVDSDLTGSLKLQTGGNDALSIDSSQVVNFAKQFQFSGVLPPAFSVYKTSVQTLSSATWTKLDFQVEEFDTNSNFASSRFTSTVAGYYQINGAVSNGLNTQTISAIYKNGSIYKAGVNYSNGYSGNVSSLVYLNGTTDYIELYGYFGGGGNSGTGIESNYFNGIMVRAA